jgi:Amt family ammonium transporter
MLWFGWFGFNAGSALTAGPLASNALLTSQIASATAGMVWLVLSWKKSKKPSVTGVITGAIAGLAGVTPAAGYISPQSAFFLGIILGFASYYGILLFKQKLRIDDALDVSSVHGLTGIIGALAIGLAASTIINPSGPNGLLYGNPSQLGIQALGVVVAAILGFGGTIIIMKVINAVIGLRVKEDEEELGLDATQHGEREYGDEWGASA